MVMFTDSDRVKHHYNKPALHTFRQQYNDRFLPKVSVNEEILLRIKPSDKVLDAGCGEGRLLSRLSEDSVGIDISSAMVSEAKHSGRDVFLGSVEKLPFEDESFDVVVFRYVLQHVSDYKKALLEASRVLKQRGRIIIANNSHNNKPVFSQVKSYAKQLGCTFQTGSDVWALENASLESLEKIEEECFRTTLEVDEDFITYVESFREFCNATNSQWEKLITHAKTFLGQEEINSFGILVARKM